VYLGNVCRFSPEYISLYVYLFLLLPLEAQGIGENFRHSVGLLGRGISPTQGRYLLRTTQTK
jgi:hypothetical protein